MYFGGFEVWRGLENFFCFYLDVVFVLVFVEFCVGFGVFGFVILVFVD